MAEGKEEKALAKNTKRLLCLVGCYACRCCPWLTCCRRDREKDPLLVNNSAGHGSVDSTRESQEMEYHFSPGGEDSGKSTPWDSETHSQASDATDQRDIEPDESVPEREPRTSWKLVSDNKASQDPQTFTIQIRKQTE